MLAESNAKNASESELPQAFLISSLMLNWLWLGLSPGFSSFGPCKLAVASESSVPPEGAAGGGLGSELQAIVAATANSAAIDVNLISSLPVLMCLERLY